MPEPLVVVRDFSYTYPDSAEPALRDVNVSLDPGTFTVLAGVSGSGKSTLLRALCGLVPHFHGGHVEGELTVAGLSVREHGPGDLAAVCGTVLQEPEAQVVMGGVRAELELPLEHGGESSASIARAVEETALALGVGHLLERRTDTLSGGELQRVAIAAAMTRRPAVLLLDEPTSQLDPVAGDELVWLLRRLNEDWGTAVVMAEHRLERCLPAADRVLALVDSRVACDASPREFLAWACDAAPLLTTPAARLFSLAGLRPPPTSVREARAGLSDAALTPAAAPGPPAPRRESPPALSVRDLWFEIDDGPAVLRGLTLKLQAGEQVALMGRNGAGKSTLLRLLKGLIEPTRGRVESTGAVALLLQNPGDYLLHEHAEQEAGPDALRRVGLEGRGRDNPRDLSGGERQRLALEIVLSGPPVAAVLLDEPTRGMDRAHKEALARRCSELADHGAAVVVATHDTEFAATFADRVVLLGPGVVIADASPSEVLGGGWHFSTDVARITDGASLTPEDGAGRLRDRLEGALA